MNWNNEIESWLIAWFAEHTGYTASEIAMNAGKNYFEVGYIDSFDFITLIESLEERYSLSFVNDAFENRAFATISGLAQICAELKHQEKQ